MRSISITSPRRQAAISSLVLSGISVLVFILVLIFGAPLTTALTCARHQAYPDGTVGLICLTPLYLSSVVSVILSFVARRVANQQALVLSARVISLFLLLTYLVLSPLLFALLYWFDSPVPC